MSSLAITGKSNVATLQGVATLETMAKARENRELQAAYVNDLVEAYRSIDVLALQVDGAKALHGAYIYRNLEELAVKGRVQVEGASVALGDAVAKALGKVVSNEGVKPLSSGSATRYKYISRVYFDAGITDEDPDWSDIVNYYVSDSRLTSVLKYRDKDAKPANLEQLVRDAVKAIRTPVVEAPKADVVESTATVVEETTETETETDSQGPENGETETETETVETETESRSPRVPAHEMSEVLPRGFSARLDFVETIVYGVKREDLKADDVKRLTVIAEEIARLIS
jgi:hypothetical protein